MPSLRHQILASVVPRLRGSGQPLTPDTKETIARRNAARDRRLPTGATRGLEKHFTHTVELVGRGDAEFGVHVLTPRSGATSTLFHLHGGAYVAGIDAFHVRWLAALALRLDARIVLPDYPLAPEFTWRDSFDAMRGCVGDWVTRALDEGGQLWLSGDSAGGGYALALAQSMRDAGLDPADKLVLVSPWLDVSLATPGTDEVGRDDPWLFPENLREFGTWWAGFETRRAEVSPLYGDVHDLPRTLMFIGTRDCLQPACAELAAKARSTGWDLTVSELQGGVHVYPLLPGLPESRQAFEQTVYFLKS